jgi:hypothetical protein
MPTNTLVTPDWITKESARVLTNELTFANNLDRQYDDQYRQAGAKMGDTVKARLPQRFRTTKGEAFQPQALQDTFVPVTLTDQANVAMGWSTAQETTDIDMIRSRYVRPAAEQLANTIDYDGCSRMYLEVYQSVGTPGTAISANLTYLTAGDILDDSAAPNARVAVLNPAQHSAIANANLALFNPGGDISRIWKKGQFGAEALGISRWFKDQNIARHTVGTYAGSPVASSAGQTGSSIATSGWTSTTLNEGDVFTFDGVFSVNPQNYQSTGRLQQFVVTATVSDAGGAITIPISPAIITSGAFQTVSGSPANNAVINVVGTTGATGSQSLIFHKEAFAMVMADLVQPRGGANSSRVSSNKLGVALRFVEQYAIGTDQQGSRLDCLYGFKAIRPQLAVRAQGA